MVRVATVARAALKQIPLARIVLQQLEGFRCLWQKIYPSMRRAESWDGFGHRCSSSRHTTETKTETKGDDSPPPLGFRVSSHSLQSESHAWGHPDGVHARYR
jgi:hypothetical protein